MPKCKGMTKTGAPCQRWAKDDGYCSDHPGQYMRKVEYAAHQGFDQSYVSQLLSSGTIEQTSNGLIDWQMADTALAESRDIRMPLKRHGDHPDEDPDGDETDPLGDNYDKRYIRARALKQEEDHQLARLKRLEEEARLVDAEQVALDFANAATLCRQKLRSIPDRVSAQAHACASAADIRRLLATEIDLALSALSDELTRDIE